MVRPVDPGVTNRGDGGRTDASALIAQIDWADGEIQGKATNISMKGLFVETEARVEMEIPVMVEFSVIRGEDLARIVASGQVVRCFDAKDTISGRMRSGLGIKFEMFLAGKRSLKRFVIQRSRSQAAGHQMRVERRSHQRVSVSLPVSWYVRGQKPRHGYLLRMPTPGFFALESSTLVATGSELDIRLALPGEASGERISATAKVTSLISALDQAGGMIVEMDLSPVELAMVNRYAKHFTEEPPPDHRSERVARRA